MYSFQPERLKKLVKEIIKYGFIGLSYYVFIKLTGKRIPCISHAVFKFYCPGCGVTRMCVALLEGDFALAFRQNSFVFCLLPLLLIWSFYKGYRYVWGKETDLNLAEKIAAIIIFLSAVAFSVLRNLPSFEFLVPIG
ncbi:MAG: DUF2752 domain-containing protein [Clostridia bacterium]|nr:DUF2752 domain-containing protein [Clostridia bacterium]